MATEEASVSGPTPFDLQGAAEAAREAGDPAALIAATVYEEAAAGKVHLDDVRDLVLERQLTAGY